MTANYMINIENTKKMFMGMPIIYKIMVVQNIYGLHPSYELHAVTEGSFLIMTTNGLWDVLVMSKVI